MLSLWMSVRRQERRSAAFDIAKFDISVFTGRPGYVSHRTWPRNRHRTQQRIQSARYRRHRRIEYFSGTSHH